MTFRIREKQFSALRRERMGGALLVCPKTSWRLG